MSTDQPVDVVVPTVGRPSLQVLLDGLAAAGDPLPTCVVVVDDRRDPATPLALDVPARLAARTRVVRSGGRGPAAARNAGWRAGDAEWVAFLDDDVEVPEGWLAALCADLDACDPDVGATQGRITVPLPEGRRPTDWERNVAGLEDATWATADMAYRRAVLEAVDGFDERFGRAYREDADLGLRVTDAGWRITRGRRTIRHPVRPAPDGISLQMQLGNAEDPFMWALHGRGWRDRAGVPRGRRAAHLLTTATAAAGLAAAVARNGRAVAGWTAAWAGLTAELAWHRIAPGPRTTDEVVRMTWTSAVLPFAATWHTLRGVAALPSRLRRPGPRPPDGPGHAGPPAAVLFDRDGTLLVDVPYNGDPDRVTPVPTAREALDLVRQRGIPTGVVTNQSGIARGLVDRDQVDAVNARAEALLGGIDAWAICPHGPDDGCVCRKPRPGLVHQVAADLDVDPRRCVVIGDIGSDVQAAEAAGARGILVPTAVTLPEEVDAATEVAPDLLAAVRLALAEREGHP